MESAASADKGWGRRSLQHAKSLLSGIFTYAKNLGVLDGINPVQGTIIHAKPLLLLKLTPLLRHISLNTTLTHYVKDVPQVTETAMTLVEELFVKPLPGTVPQ